MDLTAQNRTYAVPEHAILRVNCKMYNLQYMDMHRNLTTNASLTMLPNLQSTQVYHNNIVDKYNIERMKSKYLFCLVTFQQHYQTHPMWIV